MWDLLEGPITLPPHALMYTSRSTLTRSRGKGDLGNLGSYIGNVLETRLVLPAVLSDLGCHGPKADDDQAERDAHHRACPHENIRRGSEVVWRSRTTSRKVNWRLLFARNTKKLIATDRLHGIVNLCDYSLGYAFQTTYVHSVALSTSTRIAR